jgi:hypothetical protein
VDASLEGADVVANSGSTDTGVDLKVHVITEGDDDLLDLLGKLAGGCEDEGLTLAELRVELRERADGEGGGFTLFLVCRNDNKECVRLVFGMSVIT